LRSQPVAGAQKSSMFSELPKAFYKKSEGRKDGSNKQVED
jgi:hypothetical protein